MLTGNRSAAPFGHRLLAEALLSVVRANADEKLRRILAAEQPTPASVVIERIEGDAIALETSELSLYNARADWMPTFVIGMDYQVTDPAPHYETLQDEAGGPRYYASVSWEIFSSSRPWWLKAW